jgi:protein SCO1
MWNEEQVVDRAAALLHEQERPAAHRSAASPRVGTWASVAVAFFPKCPVCWAAYMSLLGIAGCERLPYSPWLQPLLVVLMLVNVLSVWMRARATRRMSGFYLAASGAMTIVLSKMSVVLEPAAVLGVAFTLAGSLFSARYRARISAGTTWLSRYRR